MEAARFIGRVGGLAVAFGVGTAVLGGHAIACADGPDGTSNASTRSSASNAADEPNPAGAHRTRAGRGGAAQAGPVSPAAATAPRRSSGALEAPVPARSAPSSEPSVLKPPPAVGEPAPVPAAAVAPIAQAAPVLDAPVVTARAVSAPAVSVPLASAAVLSAAGVSAAEEPVAAPQTATVSAFISAADGAPSDQAGTDPLAPEAAPLPWVTLAAARRELGIDAAAAPTAVGPSFSEKGITATPVVFVDSVKNIFAKMNLTTERTDVQLVITGLGGSNGGKVTPNMYPNESTPGINPDIVALLPYGTWLDNGGTRGAETFTVSIREYTAFDQFFTEIPIVNDIIFKPIIHFMQDMPLISTLLAPLIGSAVELPITVDIAKEIGSAPTPFTYKVKSFDGTEISANFFPSNKVAGGIETSAPAVIVGSGFGYAGQTNPYALYTLKDEVPGVGKLRAEGYNTITYDPRGRFDSGGQVHMADPEFEGKDVSALISWVTDKTPVKLDAPGDPQLGLVGGSYGAALQFAAAGDKRIDAMVPVDGWDTLLESFYPSDTFRTAYGALTILSLLKTGSRVYPPLYWAFGTGMLANFVGPFSQNLLDKSDAPLDQLTAPTLMIRGIVDVLFPLQQGTASAQKIMANGNNVPLKMQWICTGHGNCNDPYGPQQTEAMNLGTLFWLAQYVAKKGPLADVFVPTFQWYDQNGKGWISKKMPFEPGFNDLPDVVATGKGGLLPLVPLIGGSGELSLGGIVNGTDAWNSVKIDVPADKLKPGTQVVGTPKVSFTYRGLGLGGAVYAQVVNKTTGLVLGNVVMPVPVKLNGFEHTVTADIGEISYTVGEGDELEVQLVSSATAFFNVPLGLISISDVTVTMPNRTAA